ncbi:PLP-dependent aminotransferase family protein [Clostridium magnum]|uniref:2-aminoadipate transaminase n=1 Tax=Clostridium magnum DSM 2767 TaxID=1121326 RepID=A0A162QF76_9CLOT|nr:PLP-dependent aminotransferase family protein [Clostridium magnum]KZL88467.1 2-aminoadipate transaminase [Clostridium magnum DSM 2767]SHI90341.1 DNA-binding transcriptional regulator, MocR family, contains an aminotransferase domain [Clostridium magnum DSM 2767]
MIDNYGNEITWIPVIKEKNEPIYISIANCLEEDIEKGILEGGFKLPPQRVIANYLGINHGTVTRAYKLCEEKGLIKGIIGKGTFVSCYAGVPQNVLGICTNSNVIEMGMVLPLYEVNKIVEPYLKDLYQNLDYGLALRYAPPEGHLKHRYIASKWLKRLGIQYSPEQIIITSGTQNAMAVILASLFDKGDRIIVDEYTYTGFISLSKFFGIILVPVKTNEDGIDIDELKRTCKREAVKGIYLIPDCHNPTTARLNTKKRVEIAKIIEKNNLLLIEDNPYSFTVQDKIKPISYYLAEKSIYIHGTCKSISSTFRISYIASPQRYLKQLIHGVNNFTWMASPINAEIISQIINSSKYDELISSKISKIKERNRLVDYILNDYHIIPNETSFFRYLILPQAISDKDLEIACLEKGVQVFSSKRFSVGTHPNKNAIRLSISGPESIDDLRKGLLIVKEAIKLLETDINLII